VRCTSPRTVGFHADGKTICWSKKQYSKEYATFQLPCGKCIECRLDYARQWAVRCVHESKMYEKNCFITLTYDEANLESPKLIYSHFQKFMKKLRKVQEAPIGVFVTGEYGTINKRPHWHAIIFNWSPNDGVHKYTNQRGDKVFTSECLTKIWGKGLAEYGSVTFESAGYCARYASKKLVHGKDGEHEFNPISKKSSKHAIGKRWLERYWPDVFSYGRLVLPDGSTSSIPRYYEKWFKETHPEEWQRYATGRKALNTENARIISEEELKQWNLNNLKRLDEGKKTFSPSPNQRKKIISKQKFETLQANLKL